MTKLPLITLWTAFLAVGGAASATLTPVGPFAGSASESFEEFQTYAANPDFFQAEGTSILGGAATISSANQDMVIYDDLGDAPFAIDTSNAQVADGTQGLGLNSAGDAATIDFAAPVVEFGGYFGAASGWGYSGDITFDFSDGSSETLAYSDPQSTGALVWEGWSSSVGLSSVTIGGDYLVMDGLQASVPDGAETAGLLGCALAGLYLAEAARRRHRPHPLRASVR